MEDEIRNYLRLIEEKNAVEAAANSAKREIQRQLGAAMRRMREESGLSLRKLARGLGCSAPYISDMERGNRPYSEWAQDSLRILKKKNNDYKKQGKRRS